jgi:hypothetical protein
VSRAKLPTVWSADPELYHPSTRMQTSGVGSVYEASESAFSDLEHDPDE